MRYTFIELKFFAAYRANYFTDDEFLRFQLALPEDPRRGAVIAGTGGLRKVRWSDSKRGKGKRGGVRTIYYVFDEIGQIWLFTVYGKNVKEDLTLENRLILGRMLADAKAQYLR